MSPLAPSGTASRIAHRLTERLQPSVLEVVDESAAHAGHAGANPSGEGSHIRVRVASPVFTGLTRLQKHRLVYDALQDFIDQGLHALAIEVI